MVAWDKVMAVHSAVMNSNIFAWNGPEIDLYDSLRDLADAYTDFMFAGDGWDDDDDDDAEGTDVGEMSPEELKKARGEFEKQEEALGDLLMGAYWAMNDRHKGIGLQPSDLDLARHGAIYAFSRILSRESREKPPTKQDGGHYEYSKISNYLKAKNL